MKSQVKSICVAHHEHSFLPHAKGSTQEVTVQQCMETEDEGGNNNTFRQSDKRVPTRGHGKVVHGKAENRR